MDVIHPAPSTQHQINDFDAIKIQLALFVIAGSLQQTQQSPVYLPEVFAGNEEGRRSMTKAELEMFIDYRGLSGATSRNSQTVGERAGKIINR